MKKPANKKRKLRTPPVKPEKREPPSLEKVMSDIRKAYGFQLNTFLAQFLEAYDDNDINAFLPQDVSEADEWIEQHLNAFLENEEPTTDDILDGCAALFMMAFLEKLYEACGITAEDDEAPEDDDDADDDADDEDGDDYEDDED